MSAADVVVVGAGIAGAAVAYECARRGASVVLCDRGEPGAEASGAAAGMLAPCSEAHGPGPFFDLARRGLEVWPDFAAAVAEDGGDDCHLDICGLLRPAFDGDEAAAVEARAAWQRPLGVDVDVLDARAAASLEPALQEVAGAAWYPREGHVDSRAAVRALVAAFRRRGGSVRVGVKVVGASAAGGVLTADGEEVAARTVVVAAGSWSGRLAVLLGGDELPVRPVRGQLVALRGLALRPRHVVFAGLRGYALTRADGTVLVGATEEEAGFDTAVSAAATERLLATAARLLRDAPGTAEAEGWAGLRPATPDALPVLGPLPKAGRACRVLVAGGHYRNGVLLAPVTADGIATMALEGATPPGWEPFDPGRFS